MAVFYLSYRGRKGTYSIHRVEAPTLDAAKLKMMKGTTFKREDILVKKKPKYYS